MVEEYHSIIKNDVWEVVPILESKSLVSSKWIYKTKNSTNDSINKYKERYVSHLFSQKEGIDYEDTFAPITRYTSIRTILSLESKNKWKLQPS